SVNGSPAPHDSNTTAHAGACDPCACADPDSSTDRDSESYAISNTDPVSHICSTPTTSSLGRYPHPFPSSHTCSSAHAISD
ncbi:MAG: hypothetical protein ABL983_15460, partial [Nitrospira sp.]